MLALFGRFITSEVTRYGYPAVFVLMLLGSACIPIPSEVVMLLGGALASSTFAAQALGDPGKHLSIVGVVVVGAVASLFGSWAAYGLGYAGGRPLIDRWGRYLLLRPHEIDRAHDWFERHGQGAVFFARLIPLVRAFISLPAGAARMSFTKFSVYSFLGILPWTVGLALAGYGLGQSWTKVERFAGPLSLVVALAALGALVWWLARRRRQASPEVRATEGSPDEP